MREYPAEFEIHSEAWLPREELENASKETLVDLLLRLHRYCNRIARELRMHAKGRDPTEFRLHMAWQVENLLFGIEYPNPPDGTVRLGDCLPELDAHMKWRQSRQQARDEQGWDWSSEDEERALRHG